MKKNSWELVDFDERLFKINLDLLDLAQNKEEEDKINIVFAEEKSKLDLRSILDFRLIRSDSPEWKAVIGQIDEWFFEIQKEAQSECLDLLRISNKAQEEYFKKIEVVAKRQNLYEEVNGF